VAVYLGGADWSQGPSTGLFPASDVEASFGAVVVLADTGRARLLLVGAPKDGIPITGSVYVYLVGQAGFDSVAPIQILLPPPEGIDPNGPEGDHSLGFGNALGFVPDMFGKDQGALLAGIKYASADGSNSGTGIVAVFRLAADGRSFGSTASLLLAPQPTALDAFGSAIVPLDDVDGDGLFDFFVGMEGHVEGDPWNGGIQTGGIVMFY
jgi:hypothetical protein